MGYRLHVRKINRVEYSDGVFNNMNDSIEPVLNDFPGDRWVSDDESRMEMDKEDFQEGIDLLKAMSDKDFEKKYPGVAREMTRQACVDAMQSLLDEADPQGSVIALDWY